MATMTVTATMRQGAATMQQKQLSPALQEIVADVLALKALAKNDHFITNKAQREILNRLNADDLAAVARAIADAEKQQESLCKR